MKNVKKDFKNYFLFFGLLMLVFTLGSCSDDDDGEITPDPDPVTGSITAGDQTLSGNTLIVDNVTVGQDSWLVARNAGDEDSPDIVSEAVFLEAGSHDEVELRLTNTANLTGNVDGDDFTLMLHRDDPGTGAGTFDFDGTNGADAPITDQTGNDVTAGVNVQAPRLDIDDDQMVTENNEVTFNNLTLGTGGWVTLYGTNEDGTINEDDILGQQYLEAGTYENYAVPFNEGYTPTAGQVVYPRLNVDNPADQAFTYTPGGTDDPAETYGFDTATGEDMFVQNTATTGTPGTFTIGGTAGAGAGTAGTN